MTETGFSLLSKDGSARRGEVRTARGIVRTPAFMPVGSAGSVKALTPGQVRQSGADIVLGNTYHLMLRPGAERIARLGGLQRFMNWDGPILTDSGGFQIWSLKTLRHLDDDGVTFRSHLDGSTHRLTPERAIAIQADLLGADIVMQLDECTSFPVPHDAAAKSMELSWRWALRSARAFGERSHQFLFGIVQGSVYDDLREISARQLVEAGFDGYAIGGLSVGEDQHDMLRVTRNLCAILPEDKPRYLMGVGKPLDLIAAVEAGIDMFDCVLPTRSGRHGQVWTFDGPINLKNARFAEDTTPLDPNMDCPASRDYSKAYLHHLFRAREYLGPILASWHNTAFFQMLMDQMRQAIAEGSLATLAAALRERANSKQRGAV